MVYLAQLKPLFWKSNYVDIKSWFFLDEKLDWKHYFPRTVCLSECFAGGKGICGWRVSGIEETMGKWLKLA